MSSPASDTRRPTTDTDIVSLSALHLSATVGPDHWHRTRPQPIHLTLHLHLTPSYLDTPGKSDNVIDSLHYGHLAKAVERRVGVGVGMRRTEQEARFASARALVEDVTDAAFGFVRDAVDGKTGDAVGRDGVREMETEVVHAVRVVLELPKQILLAGGFEVDLTTRASDWTPTRSSKAGAIVRVTNLILPVLIGVNPPERLAKQRVVTHLTFFEAARTSTEVLKGTEVEEIDYPAIVQRIATDVENSTYLTLEKLVYEIIHTAYRASDAHPNPNSNAPQLDAITVRCQKPSALSFADASGVEMTRTREALRLVGR